MTKTKADFMGMGPVQMHKTLCLEGPQACISALMKFLKFSTLKFLIIFEQNDYLYFAL